MPGRRLGDHRGPGSRKIRDEIDALEVLGISVVQRLVVPGSSRRSWHRVDRRGGFTGFLASLSVQRHFQHGAPAAS